MIPMGMMRVKATVATVAQATVDSAGQSIPGSATTLYTPIVFVESAFRQDHKNDDGLAVWERTYIIAPWYPGIKAGMRVTLTDGSDTTVYQIEGVEDDRNKHRFVKMSLIRAEEQI